MNSPDSAIRVLHSFPHKIGASRICATAWYQVVGAADAGADVLVMSGGIRRPLPAPVQVRTTLGRGRARIPEKLLGSMRACKLHDHLVAAALPKLADQIDIVHTWPVGALKTLQVARRLGIPTVLERPNAHTRFAYESVQAECERIGVALPPGHEHAFNAEILEYEEREYELADRLLCPSDFVVQTFLDQGTPAEQMVRHIYGYDDADFRPPEQPRDDTQSITAIFVGVAAVRKGLHFALEAWLGSPASEDGTFLIAGAFLPEYQAHLAEMLAHPSVHVLGHRDDVPELMRSADVMVLPSIEEGFGLVCVEALGSDCIPLVSDACTDACRHGENALVHPVGDVAALSEHFSALRADRALLERLRNGCRQTSAEYTWTAAGERLVEVYQGVIAEHLARPRQQRPTAA